MANDRAVGGAVLGGSIIGIVLIIPLLAGVEEEQPSLPLCFDARA